MITNIASPTSAPSSSAVSPNPTATSGFRSAARPRRRLAALIAGLCALTPFAAALPPGSQVVATGLNNPRGLDFAPNGALYIAEAGTGGAGPIVQGGEGPLQFGLSGSITRVFKGAQERIVTGLPSLANAQGMAAIGPSNVIFDQLGHAAVTIGLGLNPALRNNVLAAAGGAALGTLQQMAQNGQMKLIADIAGFELLNDPDGNGPDSNPNGATQDKAGVVYVADAGANALLKVSAKGGVSVVAIFPNRIVPTPPALPQPPFPAQLPMQAVPTNVVIGPDGALYVSQLTGFPFPPGEAKIYRVAPNSAPQVYAQGFTNIIDLEFDAAGNLYVLEIDQNGLLAPSPTGRLARVNAGTQTVDTIASEGLVMPGGMTIGPDGAIYITNFSVSAGGGQVVRIVP